MPLFPFHLIQQFWKGFAGLLVIGLVLSRVPETLAESSLHPQATLRTTSGETVTGPLTGISREAVTVEVAGQERRIATTEVWQLAMPTGPGRTPRPRFWLHLTNGDRIGVSSVTLAEEELRFQLPFDESSPQLEIGLIAGIQPLRSGTTWRTDESEWLRVIRQREKSDLVGLRNGDRQTGEVSAIGASSIELTSSLGKQEFAWTAVTGLLMNPDLGEVPPTLKEGWTVLLVDESWLTATNVETTPEGRVNLSTGEGLELSISLGNVRWMTHWGPDAEPLSRQAISEQQHVPLLGEPLKVTLDGNVRGLPLRMVSGATLTSASPEIAPLPGLCPLGVGLCSGMTVRWDLQKKYRRFQCGLGLDATAGPDGHAVVRFLVDNRPPQAVTLRTGEPGIQETLLDLTDAQTLTIETGYGEHGDTSDWINLYLPILVPAK